MGITISGISTQATSAADADQIEIEAGGVSKWITVGNLLKKGVASGLPTLNANIEVVQRLSDAALGAVDARNHASLALAVAKARTDGLALILRGDYTTNETLFLGDLGLGAGEVTGAIGDSRHDSTITFNTNGGAAKVLWDDSGANGKKRDGIGLIQNAPYICDVGILMARRTGAATAGLGEYQTINADIYARKAVLYGLQCDQTALKNLRLDNRHRAGQSVITLETINDLGVSSDFTTLNAGSINPNGMKFDDVRMQSSTGWAVGQSYAVDEETIWGDFTLYPNGIYRYRAIAPHTADADNEPGVGVDWALFWDQEEAVTHVSILHISGWDMVTVDQCYFNLDVNAWPLMIIGTGSDGNQPEELTVRNANVHGGMRAWIECRGTVNRLNTSNNGGTASTVADITTAGSISAKLKHCKIDEPTQSIKLTAAGSDIEYSEIRCSILEVADQLLMCPEIFAQTSIEIGGTTSGCPKIFSGGTAVFAGVLNSNIVALDDVTISNGTNVQVVTPGAVTVTNGFSGFIRAGGQITLGSGTSVNLRGRIECLSTLPPIISTTGTDALEIFYYDTGEYPRAETRRGQVAAAAWVQMMKLVAGSNAGDSGAELYLKNTVERGVKIRGGRGLTANAEFRLTLVDPVPDNPPTEIDALKVNSGGVAGETPLMLLDVTAGILKRVKVSPIADANGKFPLVVD